MLFRLYESARAMQSHPIAGGAVKFVASGLSLPKCRPLFALGNNQSAFGSSKCGLMLGMPDFIHHYRAPLTEVEVGDHGGEPVTDRHAF